MMRFLMLLALVCALGACADGGPAGVALGAGGQDRLALSYHANAVRLQVPRGGQEPEHIGWGFVIGEDETRIWIATADHVVHEGGGQPVDFVEASFFNVPGIVRARRIDRRLPPGAPGGGDLAVLVADRPAELRPVRVRPLPTIGLVRGQRAWPVGNAAGRWLTPVQPGLYAAPLAEVGLLQFEGLNTLPGASGGPLVATDGLVGMIVQRDADGTTRVLPIERIVQAFDSWGVPTTLLERPGSPPMLARSARSVSLLAEAAEDRSASLAATILAPQAASPARPSTLTAELLRRAYDAWTGASGVWDEALALRLWQEAARAGDAQALYALGVVAEQGLAGQPRDEGAAVRLFRDAAERGLPAAQRALALALEEGAPGLTQDLREGARLLRLAADGGDPVAQLRLAEYHVNGRAGVPRDEREALRLLRAAANQGFSIALFELALVQGTGELGLTPDIPEAVRLLREAATRRFAPAIFALGTVARNGLIGPPDVAEAARLFEEAAALGHAGAMVRLGALRERGLGGHAADERTAAGLFRRAAELGHPEGQEFLAEFLEAGRGGQRRDPAEARRLYAAAAAQGSESARAGVTRIDSGAAPSLAGTFVIPFARDSAEVTEDSRSLLADAAEMARLRGARSVEIAGHVEEAEAQRTPDRGAALSAARARNAAAILQAEGAQLEVRTRGVGVRQPIGPPAEGWPAEVNRRAEVVLR